MKPWLKNRKYRVYLKTVTRDPSGTLEKPGNQDPKKSGKPGTWKNRDLNGTLEKPENWDPSGTIKNPENQDPGPWKNRKTGTLAGPYKNRKTETRDTSRTLEIVKV